MALLKRGALAALPDLAREVVHVAALGGDVVVTELTLEARLDFEQLLHSAPAQRRGSAGVHAMVPHLLAMSVLIDDDEPLYTVAQWRAFGGRNRDVAIDLFNRAMTLSGFNGADNAKN